MLPLKLLSPSTCPFSPKGRRNSISLYPVGRGIG